MSFDGIEWDPQPMVGEDVVDPAESYYKPKKCEQCGREGTRGFKTLAPPPFEGCTLPPITLCANANACRRRWPKVSEDYLDRLLG